jgi:hypothetical protein
MTDEEYLALYCDDAPKDLPQLRDKFAASPGPFGSADVAESVAQDDLVTRLRETDTYCCYACSEYGSTADCDCTTHTPLMREAAAEIERLRKENLILRKAVGEENRANRLTSLYESSQTAYKQAMCELERVIDEVERLRGQVAELLPWATAGATRGRTDSTWDAAEELLRRIDAGEFGHAQP